MLVRRELPLLPRLPTLPAFRDLFSWDPFREIEPFAGSEPDVEARFVPSFDVKETKEAYVLKADLPGVEEKDVDISLSGSRLTVSGEREVEEKEEGDVWYAWERSTGAFMRTFTLPEGIDPEHVTAEMKGGVLSIVVPKKPELKAQKIPVKGLIEKIKGKEVKA